MDQVQRIPSSQPECSMETRLLAERLRKVTVGEVIPYAWLCKLVNLDVQHKRRDLLDSARKIVQREDDMVFEAVTGTGLKRLDDVGILSTGHQGLTRMAGLSKRSLGKLACVDISTLGDTDRHRLWAMQGLLGAVAVITHPKTLEQARTMTQPQQLAWDGSAVSRLFVAPQPQRTAEELHP